MRNRILRMMNEALESVDNMSAMTKEDKKAFLEAVKSYKQYSEHIYRSGNLKEIATNVQNLVNIAETMTLNETDDWFDGITASRHMKSLKEYSKNFVKEAKEIAVRQQRLESLYEDIGKILSTYYEI